MKRFVLNSYRIVLILSLSLFSHSLTWAKVQIAIQSKQTPHSITYLTTRAPSKRVSSTIERIKNEMKIKKEKNILIVDESIDIHQSSHKKSGKKLSAKWSNVKNVKNVKNMKIGKIGKIGKNKKNKKNKKIALMALNLENQLPQGKEISSLKLFGIHVFLGEGIGQNNIFDMEFTPEFNAFENFGLRNDGEGEIEIHRALNGEMSILRGTLSSANVMRSKVNLVFKRGQSSMPIPLLDLKALTRFLDQHKWSGHGSFLLIERHEGVGDVDIDSRKYEAKIYLSEQFKIVKEYEEFHYIFYIGLPSGNANLSFLLENNEVAEKVIHLREGEVLFDSSSMHRWGLENIRLKERRTLGTQQRELAIDGGDIFYFNRKNTATIEGLNLYQYERPWLPAGMRQYLKFTHLRTPLYVGLWERKDLELPEESFIEHILHYFELDNLAGLCLVQLNFDKELDRVVASGESGIGPMNLTSAYFDRDGTFGEDATELTEKVFLLGDLQGLINAQISYTDGTLDYLTTYCQEKTYLIEHL